MTDDFDDLMDDLPRGLRNKVLRHLRGEDTEPEVDDHRQYQQDKLPRRFSSPPMPPPPAPLPHYTPEMFDEQARAAFAHIGQKRKRLAWWRK